MLLAGATLLPGLTSAQERVVVDPRATIRFATLPVEANFPEGITANPLTGQIFVGTFDAAPAGATNFLIRYNRFGGIEAMLPTGTIPMTGLVFNPRDQHVYFALPAALFGQPSRIQRVPANFDANTQVQDVAQIPDLGPPPPRGEAFLDGAPILTMFGDSAPLPNGLAFRNSDGTLFITDSLQAAVFQIADPSVPQNICPVDPSCVQTTAQDPLFASAAPPLLGVNGVVVSADGQRLYLTNTGDDRLLSMDLPGGPVTVVTDSLEGADGITLGLGNTVIVSRALGDELAVLDLSTGRILAELGEFLGIRPDGTPRGLLFPGSIVRVGNQVFASNLALPGAGLASEPEADVTRFTISRIRLPRRVQGGN